MNEVHRDVLIELATNGVTQRVIAKEIGVAQPLVSLWINELRAEGIEIPDNRGRRKKSINVDNRLPEFQERLIKYTAQRKMTKDIAEEFGVTSNTVIKWRKQLGIAPESKRGDTIVPHHKRIMKLVKEGKTQLEMAEEFGVSVGTFNDWIKNMRREGFNIPVKRVGDSLVPKHKKILELARAGWNQYEIADYYNTSQGLVSTWMKHMREEGIDVPVNRPGNPVKGY